MPAQQHAAFSRASQQLTRTSFKARCGLCPHGHCQQRQAAPVGTAGIAQRRCLKGNLNTRHLGCKEEVEASCSRDESSSKSSPELLLTVPFFKFSLVFAFVTAEV